MQAETIVLVHGLWMHGVAMRLVQRRMKRCGYDVRAYSYSTVRCDLTDNAQRLARYVEGLGRDKVHLVGHSMGGLVAYSAARRLPSALRGRVVMCGSPYADSFSGRQLERSLPGRWLLGKCMAQWLREMREAPPADAGLDVGVIAGDGGFGMGRLIAPTLPKPNDGVIAVSETRVPGMRDHIVLPVSHTAMLLSRAVVRQACAYIEHGRFDHVQPAS